MASGSGTDDEIDVGDIIDAIPTDARDGLIQVHKIGSPWNFAVQYAPGSDEEMVMALEALEKKFPTQSVQKYKTLIVFPDKE